MDVSQILQLLGTLSIGLDQPSDSDIVVYLLYLNIAYSEILQETISQNPNVPILTDTLIPGSNGAIAMSQFSQPPFIIKTVYDASANVPLMATNLQKVQQKDPGFLSSGYPSEWYMSGGNLNIYPYPSFTNTPTIDSFVWVSSTSFTINISDNSIIADFFVGQTLQLSIDTVIYTVQISEIDLNVPNQITFTVTGTPIPDFSGADSVSLSFASFRNIGVTYIPQPALLTQQMVSAQILIPPLYQYILADGAAYYVFQSETGFKDPIKMQTSYARWIEGKQRLFAYLRNQGGQKYYSTYSVV
jgi:hypothetical protein